MRAGSFNFWDKNPEYLQGYTFKLDYKSLIWGGLGHLVVNINISLLYTYRPAIVCENAKRNWSWNKH